MLSRFASSTLLPTCSRFLAELSPLLARSLKESDPVLFDIIEKEKQRQRESIVLIPSENFTSRAVLECLGSVMQNKYSEGLPGVRYYGGNKFIDMSENLCRKRALAAFNLDPKKWGVNVQPLSGSPANFEAYTAVLQPHDRILSLDLPHGGHLSHGYSTPTKKISATSIFFECMPYRLYEKGPQAGYIDYETMEKLALAFRPKLIVAGSSAYPRNYDYGRVRKICDQVGAYLMSDMAHIAGLVAGKATPSPFEYSDIVTTTTHKSLRGPRGAMIFFRKGVKSVNQKTGKQVMWDIEDRVNQAVFPSCQGGPHNHTISGISTCLLQAATPDFADYCKKVVRNAAIMAETLKSKGYKLVSGGTSNHLLLVDLRDRKVNGAKVERVLELSNIALNKNTVPGDLSALNPGGIRLGSPAMTSRGISEEDFVTIAGFIDRGIKIALDIQGKGGKTMKEFRTMVDEVDQWPEIGKLREEVVALAKNAPVVGFDVDSMLYQ